MRIDGTSEEKLPTPSGEAGTPLPRTRRMLKPLLGTGGSASPRKGSRRGAEKVSEKLLLERTLKVLVRVCDDGNMAQRLLLQEEEEDEEEEDEDDEEEKNTKTAITIMDPEQTQQDPEMRVSHLSHISRLHRRCCRT